ncbi:MAG: AbrB/MazE/SpoVT family DNA-binding domain-containing protein [Thermoproteota archaeon]|jgi:AbrB family looped-hinge helix DNA binding protein|uniref:AbrB/MazE/SpoVT family DNA-binding domain-containing protein n=1 Tax=Candidatus Methanodesulfokora washburnensis TaxID=2478471 RepID=A0A520KJY3_9CREN|nr:MAG: AbrB/MazE/SpoVT family DNA-binding domain-containing protein [Candidatus Methanodesulfokores washburnensis]TDA38659.1 MAG: AbrB/MazE/SpoVT family DNA-binding domain-containing protein [Candidatus Korarchaeota archaeon]
MWKVRLSSKGQIVIPAEVRSQLGLKKGSILTVRLEGKKMVIEPVEELPQEVFIEAEEDIVDRALAEAKESSDKAKQLLRDLGVG